MKTRSITLFSILSLCLTFLSCEEDKTINSSSGFDKFLIGTNITTANPVTGYIGTLKDLTIANYTNTKSRQTTAYPYVAIHKNDVFLTPYFFGDVIKKYTRQADGTLLETGSLPAPAASAPLGFVVESDTKAYCSLFQAGKILVINPSTMSLIETIDLSKYGLGGDGNPDPNVMEFNNGKLYVACSQTSDGFTSKFPVQVLIIDTKNGNSITSITDARSTWAGSINEQKSIFFDEAGDMYIYCVASYGFGGPTQKSGFLRVKKGQTTFDPSYFFNTSDYTIIGIAGSKVDYLQRMRYAGNGIVYSTGNIYSLASNPPDYVKDRTYGSFKVDLANKTITKLDLPYSNGYAASVCLHDGKVLWGLATSSGVGIYSYDPATNKAGTSPIVNTQGDPNLIEVFN
ncbi:MAG: YncE family protein [Leadbetterella sp.]